MAYPHLSTTVHLNCHLGPACAAVALIPRALSDSYTDLEPGGAGPLPNPPSYLAYATRFDRDAVRATYGSPAHPDTYLHACPLTGIGGTYREPGWMLNATLGWYQTFHVGFREGYANVRQAAQIRGRATGACCEYRLTWRMAGRLVPVAVVPLHFVGAGTLPYMQRWERAMFGRHDHDVKVRC